MAKSNLILLQEAIADGDLERAQELTAKLVKTGKIKTTKTKVDLTVTEKAPRKPAKASKAKAATKPPTKAKAATKSKPAAPKPRNDIAVNDMDESSYLAPSRAPGFGNGDDFGGRKFVGPDGKEHTYAKRVSMEGIKFVNKFSPEGYKDLSVKEKKLEKQIKGLRSVPRPGQRGAQREVAKKIEARCVICRNVVMVYPWEAETVDGESNFRCSKKSCIKAR